MYCFIIEEGQIGNLMNETCNPITSSSQQNFTKSLAALGLLMLISAACSWCHVYKMAYWQHAPLLSATAIYLLWVVSAVFGFSIIGLTASVALAATIGCSTAPILSMLLPYATQHMGLCISIIFSLTGFMLITLSGMALLQCRCRCKITEAIGIATVIALLTATVVQYNFDLSDYSLYKIAIIVIVSVHGSIAHINQMIHAGFPSIVIEKWSCVCRSIFSIRLFNCKCTTRFNDENTTSELQWVPMSQALLSSFIFMWTRFLTYILITVYLLSYAYPS